MAKSLFDEYALDECIKRLELAPLEQPRFLPMSQTEVEALGWRGIDILLVSGDAYVDHPSFGVALLGRMLVDCGFKTGIVAQPPWLDKEKAVKAVAAMGRPRLFAGISAGALDSMLAHYTAFRKLRRDDAYTPGGNHGVRPNRATIVYTGLVRQAFPGIPVVLGGIEASLRRATHYDFWSDSLRRSILAESKADLLVYGMGERALFEIATNAALIAAAAGSSADGFEGIDRKLLVSECSKIRGLVSILPGNTDLSTTDIAENAEIISLPGHDAILENPSLLVTSALYMEKQVHQASAYATQAFDASNRLVLISPPARPLSSEQLDHIYELGFSRLPHPAYTEAIPAWEMIRTSVTTHRGCAGGCSFCSLALHQGRRITSRSKDSILDEVETIARGPSGVKDKPSSPPRWAGSISDVGGPSANMWQAVCTGKMSECQRSSCLFPDICPCFKSNQSNAVRLLRECARLPDVRHVRVASGVRYDLALTNREALAAYTGEFTGGQLKIAPEHISEDVLALMRKPGRRTLDKFLKAFYALSQEAGKEQYTVVYLMSAFPGCTLADMRELAAWLKQRNFRPEQVQCFIPTPGTVASAMFYAGVGPDLLPIYVAKTDAERLAQHKILIGDRDAEKRRPVSGDFSGQKRDGRHRSEPVQKNKKTSAKYGAKDRAFVGKKSGPGMRGKK